jgi:glycosyltransferase involved in cell wall biosynthesis
MREHDAIVVPSQTLETGPLVALESLAAGVPVIGSNLGGIAERIHDGVNGLLVDASDPDAWAAAFDRLLRDRALLPSLRGGIVDQPGMSGVSDRMKSLYLEFASPAKQAVR